MGTTRRLSLVAAHFLKLCLRLVRGTMKAVATITVDLTKTDPS